MGVCELREKSRTCEIDVVNDSVNIDRCDLPSQAGADDQSTHGPLSISSGADQETWIYCE